MSFDATRLSFELQAVGVIGLVGVGPDSISCTDPNDPLIPLVRAAHDKALSSAEAQTLCAALGGVEDSRWLAYVEARKTPLRNERRQRFMEETDELFFVMFEDAKCNVIGDDLTVTLSDATMKAWLAAKQAIRTELPYPDEE